MTRALRDDVSSLASVRCLQADVAALPFRSAAFDCVVSGFAVHILSDPAAALVEVHRVLRPGGSVVFSTPGPGRRPVMQRYSDVVQTYAQRAAPELWAMQPPPDLRATLQAVGFVSLTEGSADISIPMPDADTFLATEMSHGFRGWVDALSPADRSAFLGSALDALREVAAAGTLTMDRGARLIRATKPALD